MTCPILKSQRLTLRPFDESHLTETYVTWLNDPVVSQFSEQRHRHHTLESCRHFVDNMQTNGHFFWAIELAEQDDEHIGNLSGYYDQNNQICELSILIGSSGRHNKGLGLESWSLAQDWLLDHPNIRKTHAGTMACNKGMLKVFEKSGMAIEGRRLRHYRYKGEEIDLVYAGKFKS